MIINEFILSNASQGSGRLNCFVKIKGRTLKLGKVQPKTKINLYSLSGVLMQTTFSNEFGEYVFCGVGKGETYTIIGFDNQKQFNAVIQDNVVPK